MSTWSSQEASAGRWISCALGQVLAIRWIAAVPRWEESLSTIQNTRSALAYGSVVITCSASRANGPIPGSVLAPAGDPAAVDIPGGQVGQRAAAVVVVHDSHRAGFAG